MRKRTDEKGKMKKGIRGITLIALVVTIVVLLILAGASLNLVIGNNGIIRKAEEAREETIIGEEKSLIEMARMSIFMNKNGESSITSSEMQNELTNMGAKVEVTPAGKNMTIKYTDTNHEYSLKQTGEITDKIETAVTDVWYKISTEEKTIYFNNTESTGYKKVEDYDEDNLPEWSSVWNSSTKTYEPDITTAIFETKISPTSTAYWFYKCRNLTTINNIENLNTSNVMNMNNMFRFCDSLKTLDVSNFDTSNVTDMSSMFDNCCVLETLDVSNFNTSKVTDMSYMFEECYLLTTLDVTKFDTRNVTNMDCMFFDCIRLETLDVSNFDTSKVTDMLAMLAECEKMTTLDVSNFDTINVTNMQAMFEKSSGLTTLDLSNFNTSKVTKMRYMFEGCSNLTTIYVKTFDESTNTGWTTSAVTLSFDEEDMFKDATNIVGGNGTTYNSSYTDKTYARIDTADTPGYLTSK